MATQTVAEPETTLDGQYDGERGALLRLAVVTALLTTVTLGIYRFWARTRIRRYIWSSISDGRDSFEYTGTGLEKFLGFLMAVVILAVYLGVVQMILFYFGLTLLGEPQTPEQAMLQSLAFSITFVAVLPLIFFAQYRVRRYKLARTRWRGIRFGAEKGAWGYAFRAIGHWLLTILSLGLLLPWQTWRLERYMTDRSWYGDAPFQQGGRWTALLPAMSHIYAGLCIMIGGGMVAGLLGQAESGGVVAVLGFVWLLVGVVVYRVRAFIYLTENKVLDGNIWFELRIRATPIVSTVFLGGLMVGLITVLIFGGLGAAVMFLLLPAVMLGEGAVFIAVVAVAGLYLLALAVSGSLVLVWILQPIIHQVVEAVTIRNADELDYIEQRGHDTGADAEGFADALDVGGAI